MDIKAAYEEHLEFMQEVYRIDDISERELVDQFNLLLQCIPNGGKLYKYRSLCGKSFSYIYDSLANGYLWLSSATMLNDDNDSLLIGNAEQANKDFVDSLFENHHKLFAKMLKQFGEKPWKADPLLKDIPFDTILSAFDPISGEMDDTKLISVFAIFMDGAERFNHFRLLIPQLLEDLRRELNKICLDLFLINKEYRDNIHVFSMSDSYDLGNMWGYYADSGQGFCIEYDYTMVKTLGLEAMRYLLNTYKMTYSDIPREIPLGLIAKSILSDSDKGSVNKIVKRSILERTISKDCCWEHEREWRIALAKNDCKIPVDIVSAIIIDERSLGKQMPRN